MNATQTPAVNSSNPTEVSSKVASRNELYLHILTLPNGEQFLTPSSWAGERAREARGGSLDCAELYLKPSELRSLKGQYRWRPNSKTHWREWEDAPKAASADWKSIFHTREETENAPELAFAIDGFLQDDGITFIGGPSGHGKTFIMLEMAKRLLEGGKLFGHFAVNRKSDRVLYLVPEVSLGPFVHRLKLFGLEKHVGSRFFYRTLSQAEQNVTLTDPRILEAAKCADVFLDTAVRFMSGEENSASDHRAFAETLFALLKQGGGKTVTGAHHSPKGFEHKDAITLDNALRGSGDIGAMLSTAWAVRQTDFGTNRVYMKNVKPRDFEPCQPFEIEGRPWIEHEGGFRMFSAPGTARSPHAHHSKSDSDVEIARTLKAQGKTDEQVSEALGIDERTLRRWRSRGKL